MNGGPNSPPRSQGLEHTREVRWLWARHGQDTVFLRKERELKAKSSRVHCNGDSVRQAREPLAELQTLWIG